MLFAPMSVQDLDEALDIERRSFPEPWSRGMFLHELKLPFSKSIVVRADDPTHELLGYVCWWLIGEEIQILNVAVHPERRRHGIGRALVGLVFAETEAQHVSNITLEVRRGSTAAIALYRSFGFTESGVRRHYYGRGEDALLMTWRHPQEPARAAAQR